MPFNPRILILTASYGNGHIQASKALQQQFLKQGIEQVKIVNLIKEGHPWIYSITSSLISKSTKSSKLGLDYYGWSYYLTRETKETALFQKSMTYLGQKKLRELIQKERPDVVVNTFPFGAAPIVCSAMGVKNFTVLTDYALHATWLHPKVDRYYVATEDLKQQIIFKGYNKDCIEVSGIPLKQEFAAASIRAQSQPLSLRKKIILIMATESGVTSYLDEMLDSLLLLEDCQLVVICGHNEKLKDRLEADFAAYPGITILGFVDNVHEWMSRAMCIVTKAGGLTLTEAIALRLPVFVYKPNGGQEKENALYLSRLGVASIANKMEDFYINIQQFVRHPTKSEEMRARMASLQRNHAAAHIVNDMLMILDNSFMYASI
ncbi:MGDG synthase family glycosyltransferase [Paenibacillus anseongense]|uniref:MGDG synthase family glycosyltransferase n=1 Tax=Paenibacillus TaxID=44249 RepID=UPI002DBD8481|nr:glycosyltransferase [Paenibacillus anseongense]MEC0265489.1 glycosyltransferase [Paenibacillus anseongense]